MTEQPQFLYLTTIGRKSGKPHQIEIWFVEHGGSYYVVSEGRDQADFVRNIAKNPAITFSVGTRDDEPFEGTGRALDPVAEPGLVDAVAALMDAKYAWSEGLIIELKPDSREEQGHGRI